MEGLLYALFGILGGLLIALLVRMRLTPEKEEQLNRMEEKQEKIMAYLDGIPALPKTNPIRKGFYDAVLAIDKKEWDEAIEIFRNLLPKAEGSQKVALLNHIGICFYNQSKLEQALGYYKESLELAEEIQDEKGIVANLNNIGVVYAAKKDYDTAIRDYNKAIELDPNYAAAFCNRGIAYYNKKNYDTAIRDYDKAIEIDPNFAEAFYNRGLAYYNKKNYDTAIRDYTRAIELDPNDADAMVNMGSAYLMKEDKEKARQWYEKALERQEYLSDGGELVRQLLKELEE